MSTKKSNRKLDKEANVYWRYGALDVILSCAVVVAFDLVIITMAKMLIDYIAWGR